MKFVITLERDEDGVWIAECPSIPGCISQGATKDEAAANIHEAILGCLEVRAEQGMPLTVETRLVEVVIARWTAGSARHHFCARDGGRACR